ncbi:unnamed protein product [Rotaria magnacalcarata]|uniref:Glycosyl hydrolase family 95 N-terminal domain-containing protein n=1 Tax=Rotaria magnacalcarata TaxID=392030 RepID=A0A816U708_9BILA|nr:unnamed protein product [Rotaria magnacalcarata]CAF2158192.1 unnamed protein product [Rotaria magnacalcarata]CAF3796467.1 unnamed protein product [Rotaria magnacalcarata]CAF3827096.1 unnamed protein product [Rotaria magnacalcarata]
MILSDLHLACYNGDLEKVKLHLNNDNINEIKIIYEEEEEEEQTDQWIFIKTKKLTPIICAIENNHLSIVRYLYEQGANIYLLEPLKLACQYKYLSIIDYLLNILIIKYSSILPKSSSPSCPLSLWYEKPASQWLEALPIGNGYMGGMIYGGYPRETIQLNSDTLWAGCPHDYSNPDAFHYLEQIRQLIENNQWNQAQTILTENFFGKPIHQAPYQTVGNLFIDFFGDLSSQSIDQYQRELNLEKGITTISYSIDNEINHQRTCFASYPDNSIIYKIEASPLNSLNSVISFSSPQKIQISIDTTTNTLIVDGIAGDHETMPGSIRFRLLINIQSDGELYLLNDRLIIFESNFLIIRIAIATNYINYANITGDEIKLSNDILNNCLLYNYEQLIERHLNDYQLLFNRVQLNLGETEFMLKPTDRRIELFSQNPNLDPQLMTLYFQFGRYLLISSSRPGSQPATLQGIWNDSMTPPWDSKYTININIQMNYWPVGPANLIECYQPLFDLIQDISQTGQSTAKLHYGTTREDSWVCHHNTDIWRGTAPVDDAIYGTWPTGGIWLCKSIWDHYLFTNDKTNLFRYYPILRSAAQFFLETLIKSSNYLLTSPSMSPEVPHHVQLNAVVCQGPTLDILLIKDLFHSIIETSRLFNIDVEFREEIQQVFNQLAPLQIGKLGQLQEWFQDWDQSADIHNRHMSHLYCVFPGNSITNDPSSYRDAAMFSLDLRGIFIPSPGWSLAWKSNIWARFHQGSNAFKLLCMLLTPTHTAPNLFDLIDGPPFQIDANFGATSAICEILLQSQNNNIELLPALPIDNWSQGFVCGLRARGNYQVNIWWNDGLLSRAEIIPLSNKQICKIIYKNKNLILENLLFGCKYHISSLLELTHQSNNTK